MFKNNKSIKLINYYKFINYNLIYKDQNVVHVYVEIVHMLLLTTITFQAS